MACAAVSGLTARITRTELTTISQTKSGMRNSVIPLQRRQNAVVMKLIAPPMEPKPLRIKASAQKSVLWPREKARSVSGEGQDRWAGVSPLAFVREFMAYFRAMGYPLLRSADYPRMDAFLDAMAHLRDADLLDPHRLQIAIDEADRFQEFLTELFDAIGRREELAGAVFDRRAAAEALKLYLGD